MVVRAPSHLTPPPRPLLWQREQAVARARQFCPGCTGVCVDAVRAATCSPALTRSRVRKLADCCCSTASRECVWTQGMWTARACRVLLRWCVRLAVAWAVAVVLAATLLVVAVDTDTDLMGFGATDTSLSAVRVLVSTGSTIGGVAPHRLEGADGINEWVYVPGLEADFKKINGARSRFKLGRHSQGRHPFIDTQQMWRDEKSGGPPTHRSIIRRVRVRRGFSDVRGRSGFGGWEFQRS